MHLATGHQFRKEGTLDLTMLWISRKSNTREEGTRASRRIPGNDYNDRRWNRSWRRKKQRLFKRRMKNNVKNYWSWGGSGAETGKWGGWNWDHVANTVQVTRKRLHVNISACCLVRLWLTVLASVPRVFRRAVAGRLVPSSHAAGPFVLTKVLTDRLATVWSSESQRTAAGGSPYWKNVIKKKLLNWNGLFSWSLHWIRIRMPEFLSKLVSYLNMDLRQ